MNWFTDFFELSDIDGEDDFQQHYITINFRPDGSIAGLHFDICDIRTICLQCGNGTDSCTCPHLRDVEDSEGVPLGPFHDEHGLPPNWQRGSK